MQQGRLCFCWYMESCVFFTWYFGGILLDSWKFQIFGTVLTAKEQEINSENEIIKKQGNHTRKDYTRLGFIVSVYERY